MENLENNYPVEKVIFFKLVDSKYRADNGLEISTDDLLRHEHKIIGDSGYLILPPDNLSITIPEHIDVDNPKFEEKGKVHDWRNYVPEEWQAKWLGFSKKERRIIIALAEARADIEFWD